MKFNKKYDELTFADDFLFCKILSSKPELAKQLLEIILKVKIRSIKNTTAQYAVDNAYAKKGVRFDVYVEGDDTVYDIDMQVKPDAEIGRRMRYYQSMIDLNLLDRGAYYQDLPKSVVIFICKDAPFKESNLPVYTFKYRCLEDASVNLGDDTMKILLNAAGDLAQTDEAIATFLDFVKTGRSADVFTGDLQNEVKNAILKEEWRTEFMTLEMKLMEERREGRAEGRAEERDETKLAVQQAISSGKSCDEVVNMILSGELNLQTEQSNS